MSDGRLEVTDRSPRLSTKSRFTAAAVPAPRALSTDSTRVRLWDVAFVPVRAGPAREAAARLLTVDLLARSVLVGSMRLRRIALVAVRALESIGAAALPGLEVVLGGVGRGLVRRAGTGDSEEDRGGAEKRK